MIQNDASIKNNSFIKSAFEANENVNSKTYEERKLKRDFPQYFDKNGKFNFEKFKSALDESNIQYSDEEFSQKESYSLNFVGKKFAQILTGQEPTTVITPDLEHNNKPENINSENVYIKGDNLEALKHMLNSYEGKIKCIYIDPPYNTGSNDFAYPDNFKYDKITLLKLGLTEEEAEKVEHLYGKSTHSAWLTFMLPRLILARDLLSDDGVIFVSIDDNEQANLKTLCDEIFGEDCVDTMVWRKSGVGRDGKMKNTSTFRKDHEYIIVCFNNELILNKSFEKPNWENVYGNPDNDPRGGYKAGSISKKEEASNPNHTNYYKVTSPSGKSFIRQFDVPKEEFDRLNADNRIFWGMNGDAVPAVKIFQNEKRYVTTSSYINENKNYISNSCIDAHNSTTTKGSKELEEILNIEGIGNEMRPKPTDLLLKLLQIGSNKDSIVLDFFSGSATTADAIMQLNTEDGAIRKYILVNIQEQLKQGSIAHKAGYRTICDIGIDRIKKAAKKIKQKTNVDIDYGFKIYELNTPSDNALDKVLSFDETINQLYPEDYRQYFEFNDTNGEDTILQTWKVDDGYGFNIAHKEIYLDNLLAYLVKKNLYLINPTTDDFVKPLIEKLDNELKEVNKIVVFGYSYTLTQQQSLHINIKNFNDVKNQEDKVKVEVRY